MSAPCRLSGVNGLAICVARSFQPVADPVAIAGIANIDARDGDREQAEQLCWLPCHPEPTRRVRRQMRCYPRGECDSNSGIMRLPNWRIIATALIVLASQTACGDFWDFEADQELCERSGPDVDAQIAACTRQIDSGHRHGHDLAIEYYDRGIAWKAKGDLDRAIADYSEAIRLDPKYEHAYGNRGNAWKAKGDLDRAIADYDEAIRLNPKDASAYSNRGVTGKAKGDLDRGIADYDQAIRLDPKDADPYTNRGVAWKAKGDLDRGIADYSEAILLNPKHASSYYNRGIAWVEKRSLQKALADFETYSQLVPSDPDGPKSVARVKKELSAR